MENSPLGNPLRMLASLEALLVAMSFPDPSALQQSGAAAMLFTLSQRVRTSVAASLCRALQEGHRSPTIDRVIACEALRHHDGIRLMDVDAHSMATMLSAEVTRDDEPLDAAALSQSLLQCIEGGGSSADSMIQRFSERNDIVQLCRDVVLGAGITSQYYSQELSQFEYVLAGDIPGIKRLIVCIMPETLDNDMTERQQEVTQLAEQMAYGLWSQSDIAEQPLGPDEIRALAAKYPKSESFAESVRAMRVLTFTLKGLESAYLADKEEISAGYEHGLFKSATVLSGAMLESLLKEYLNRKKADLDLLLAKSPHSILGSRMAPWCRPEDLCTWSLDPLIKAAAQLASDKCLRDRWIDLQRARNSVHGATVDRSMAAFALATVMLTVELLFPNA
jgi:hypothetical protein